ncbi:hypothetical protein SAMN04489761_4305 [Tenacibaculum sp. MAR_2009_124]|uniref:hypothetical protein n=1 Tax=Tenacibaculum sp. MAR_2009_124 TaxID=1250059 RepID=UPI0008957D46|nr:hypothetical protein [Tenacibaculum sp. MAR_2009_124]SED11021.1 hypothetical protein SAMN04489761_4305 [Tenacibaculum sp. MAR_2009_124]
MKISFDFDSTLSEPEMQELALKFISKGVDVSVTTSRREKMQGLNFSNEDLFEVTDKLGINRDKVVFTNFNPKYQYLKDFDMHFDDDEVEINDINNFPIKCIGFFFEPKVNTNLEKQY